MSKSTKLTREDLYTLEKYAEIRDEFRKKIIAHKETRRVELGDHLLLLFEDKLIMQYQIQEMLKAEKIFEAEGIEEELAAYNPLIPDGDNWKATMMIQYADVEVRQQKLSELIGIEDLVWMRVDGHEKVYAIADEDLERDNATKTSAVHFLRFQLTDDMVRSALAGADLSAGVQHLCYQAEINPLPGHTADALRQDLTPVSH